MCEVCQENDFGMTLPNGYLSTLPNPMHQETKAAMDSTIVGVKAGYEKAKDEILALLQAESDWLEQHENMLSNYFTETRLSFIDELAEKIKELELKEQV